MAFADFWKGLFGGDDVDNRSDWEKMFGSAGRANSALGELGINTEGMSPDQLKASGAGEVPGPAGGGFSFQAPNPVALGLQVGGAFTKAGAAEDAARRKMALAKAMGDYKLANAGEQTGVVNKYLEGNTPAARDAATISAANDAKLGYEQSVGAAQAFAKPGEASGNVSDAFKTARTNSADAVSARNNKLIEALSTMRAPGLVNATNARRFGLASGQVGGLKSAAGAVGDAYGTDMGNVQVNPWAAMSGDVMSGIGSGIAMNDSAAKTAAALKKALA